MVLAATTSNIFWLVPAAEKVIFHTVALNGLIETLPDEGIKSLPPLVVAFPGVVAGVGQSRVRTVTFATMLPEVLSATGNALKEKVYLATDVSKLTRSLSTDLTLKL